ncbi:U32 family peptidase [Ureaplasma ceti]|uniref:Peptidase U32 family protein n=1 Tax=Ureaplasma ceti TaxID=3119530 RepID=A0ABP9U695_9BACT
MKIISSPADYQNALDLINHHTDVLLVTDSQFGVRNVYDCSLEDLKKIVANKQQTQIWVAVNAFFYEQDLEALTNYLKELAKLNIDKVVFNDYAVPQIDFEENLNLNLHYDPNTLVTSYGQFEFYLENNFKSASLANELFLPEVLTMLKNKPAGLELALQAHGFVFIMHSRWNLVTNFRDYVTDKDDEYIRNRMIYIREESREWPNVIYEDRHGTHMFSGYELCLVQFLDKLNDAQLDYIRLDNVMNDDPNYALKVLDIYQNALNSLSDGTYAAKKDEYYKELEQLAKDKKISSGFIGGPLSIKHYENKR